MMYHINRILLRYGRFIKWVQLGLPSALFVIIKLFPDIDHFEWIIPTAQSPDSAKGIPFGLIL